MSKLKAETYTAADFEIRTCVVSKLRAVTKS